ncbi:MAG: 2'-deoxycytidine 5'-triphosphate deaminase [Alphaproteobacteria bacterium]|nr:2'-deoxycytidine 5'-triphosphate deaminase [Alphaproteobacteria bacterium]
MKRAKTKVKPADGVLPSQELEALRDRGVIHSAKPWDADQLQPASLDLRLGSKAYRVRASFLPGEGASVESKIKALGMHEIDLREGAVLERGCVYIVPLMEGLKLDRDVSALANPKSSIGRLDVFTRVIVDRGTAFDRIPEGYRGPLYAEIAPRTFSVKLRQGSRLCQLRLKRGEAEFGAGELLDLHRKTPLVHYAAGKPIVQGDAIGVTIDLAGAGDGAVIGYRAKRHTDVVDVDRKGDCDAAEFWEPIRANAAKTLILDPNEFYILATREAVSVPPDFAAEMIAYDTMVGEFRVHYAGFFDPGFGWDPAGGKGSRAVLEVRSHEVPYVLEHGQIVGWLRYEKLAAPPALVYGRDIGSHYQGQGLQLSKHFRKPAA